MSASLDGFTFDDLLSTEEPRTGDLVIVRVGDFRPHDVQLSAREYGGALLTAKVMARSTSGATVGVVLQVWGYDQPVVLPLYHARVQRVVRPTAIMGESSRRRFALSLHCWSHCWSFQ